MHATVRCLLFFLLILLSGCATTRTATPGNSRFGPCGFNDPSKHYVVELKDGSLRAARRPVITLTELAFTDDAGTVSRLPRESVRDVRIRSSAKGAGDGFLIGGLAGFALGAAVYALTNEEPAAQGDCGPLCIASDATALGMVAGAASGGLLGLLVGSVVGHSDRCVISDDASTGVGSR